MRTITYLLALSIAGYLTGASAQQERMKSPEVPGRLPARCNEPVREEWQGLLNFALNMKPGRNVKTADDVALFERIRVNRVNQLEGLGPEGWGLDVARSMLENRSEWRKWAASTREAGQFGQSCILQAMVDGWRPGKEIATSPGPKPQAGGSSVGKSAGGTGANSGSKAGVAIDAAVSECVKPNTEGGDYYGGVKNVCPFAIAYVMCFDNIQKDSTDTWAFHCDREGGLWAKSAPAGSLGAGKVDRRGMPVGGRAHVFACKEPYALRNARWEGARIKADCVSDR